MEIMLLIQFYLLVYYYIVNYFKCLCDISSKNHMYQEFLILENSNR